MSGDLTTTAANMLLLGLIAMGSAPAFAANYRDYRPWSHSNNWVLVNYHPDTRRQGCPTVLLPSCSPRETLIIGREQRRY
jgi:hypothetical protein